MVGGGVVVVGMRDASKSIVMKTYDLLENLFHHVQNLAFMWEVKGSKMLWYYFCRCWNNRFYNAICAWGHSQMMEAGSSADISEDHAVISKLWFKIFRLDM